MFINGILNEGLMEIKAVRKQKGITQPRLRNVSRIDQSSISRMENGKQSISLKNLYLIADALEVSIESLFRGDS
ncbi:MAG TPA: XRE family transcriptional regulator [Gammaproteobacteria bacterium]|nr:XRE family transcriptional regulator [Gammaproteobacteria bacterium]